MSGFYRLHFVAMRHVLVTKKGFPFCWHSGMDAFVVSSPASLLFRAVCLFCATLAACSYVPVTKKGYWQIDMEDVTVSGESVTTVKSAILDSGTSLLVGPSEDVKAIASKVVGSFSFSFCFFCFVFSLCSSSFVSCVFVFFIVFPLSVAVFFVLCFHSHSMHANCLFCFPVFIYQVLFFV